MRGEHIPSVLAVTGESSISTERALKQIITLLEAVDPDSDSHEDRLNASIDDAKVMLKAVER